MKSNRNKWWLAFLLMGIVLVGIFFLSGESAPSALANHTTFVQSTSTTAQPTSTAHSTTTATPTPPTLLTDSQVGGHPIDSVAVVRYRFVNINRAALDGNSFALPLFDGVTMTAVMDNRQDLRDAIGPGAGDGFLWTGHLIEPGSEQAITGSLVLVIAHSDFIVARVSQPGSSHIYVVHYAGDGINGVHALYDMDLNLVPPGAEPIRNPDLIPPDPQSIGTRLTGGAEPPPSKRVGGNIDTPAASNTIGYIGVATTNAIQAAGPSISYIQADFETMIAYTNVALANSEIDAAFQLEAIGGEAYTESGNIGTDLSRLGNCSDGYMDDVCVWRQSYGGDLAQLAILGTSGNVGMATQPGWASVSFWDQLLLSGASHEVGHNMCAGHAREDGGQGCWGDSYGYNSPSGFFGDIMSYRQEGQSLYQGYSNPDVYYCPSTCGGPSFPTGISKPDPNSANNARVMNYMAPIIAAWCGGGSCSN